jgi:hypothetical protein
MFSAHRPVANAYFTGINYGVIDIDWRHTPVHELPLTDAEDDPKERQRLWAGVSAYVKNARADTVVVAFQSVNLGEVKMRNGRQQCEFTERHPSCITSVREVAMPAHPIALVVVLAILGYLCVFSVKAWNRRATTKPKSR